MVTLPSYVIITFLSNGDCSEDLHCTRQWRWGVLIETSGDKLGFNMRHLAVSYSTGASSLCQITIEIHSTTVFCVYWHLIISSSSTGQGLFNTFEAQMLVFLREKNSFLLDMLLGLTFPCTQLHYVVLHMLILYMPSLAQSYPCVYITA